MSCKSSAVIFIINVACERTIQEGVYTSYIGNSKSVARPFLEIDLVGNKCLNKKKHSWCFQVGDVI